MTPRHGGGAPAAGSRARVRRALIKGGAALTGGIVLAGGYARPSLRSVALVEVAYASAGPGDKKEKEKKPRP
jgi:hypothetical protein